VTRTDVKAGPCAFRAFPVRHFDPNESSKEGARVSGLCAAGVDFPAHAPFRDR
jgi:hypothetical protein